MIKGTGSHEPGYIPDENETYYRTLRIWGKTGTVISGTNSHCGYGIFIGGSGRNGIVSILRKGSGTLAAGYSAKILSGENKKIFRERQDILTFN